MLRPDPVRVVVPATSANLGPGFDALGLALSLEDTVTAVLTPGGFSVAVTGEGAGELPAGEDHLIVATMLATFRSLSVRPPAGLHLDCVNRIPHARGLGSSSAAIIAGILLARELAQRPFPDADVLVLAAQLEGHPDNVAPCLLGGFTIAWLTAAQEARAVSLRPAAAVRAVVYIPTERGLTAHARAALPATVPHADAAFNAGRSALLVHALTQDPSLLLEATQDRLHQDYRAPTWPQTAALVASLRSAGIPAVVSGAGPSVLALPIPGQEPPEVSGWFRTAMPWSPVGARIVDARHAVGDPVASGRAG